MNESSYKFFMDVAFEIAGKLSSQNYESENYQILVDVLCRRFDWDYGEVWLVNSGNQKIEKSDILYYNYQKKDLVELDKHRKNIAWRINEGIPGRAWGEKKAIWISDLKDTSSIHSKNDLLSHNISSAVAIPIFTGEYMIAVVFLMSMTKKKETPEFSYLLEIIAERLGMQMIKIGLERDMRKMKVSLAESIDLNFSTLNKILMYRDPYTVDHQKKVANVAAKIAISQNINESTVHDIILAAQLHDIGKLAVPIEILNKPGKISKEEFDLIKTHVTMSNDLISGLPCDVMVSRMIQEHHERENGTGYPNGLKSQQISQTSKILIISDVISAMLEDRPYRKGFSKDNVIAELNNGRDNLFYAPLVDSAIDLLTSNEFTMSSVV